MANDVTPQSHVDMDEALLDYFHSMFLERDGAGRNDAECTLYGVELFLPDLKRKLQAARLALRGWRRMRPPRQHPPLTYPLAVLIACRLAVTGYMDFAIATLLAFDTYLRVGELVGLRVADVADAGDDRLGGGTILMSIRLAATKTGPEQWAEVRDPAVRTLVCAVLESRKRGGSLFNFTTHTFRVRFKAACAELGLSESYVPHSLRHGGATRDFMAGASLEEVLRRGRWATTKSARHYIQSGRAILFTMEVAPETAHAARTLAGDVVFSLALTQ